MIAVGGAGAMGRWAVRTIARLGSAARLTIADLDVERASRLADEVGPPSMPLSLDATDYAAMRRAFDEHDVVVNTMGPFATFFRPIVEAAIASGCHYLDINDDWQPTLDAYALDAAARRQGLHVIVGLGGSPGVTNLCAVLAADRLDRVDTVYTGWKVAGASIVDEPLFPAPRASAATDHWIHQCSGPIRVWDNGAEALIDPVQRVEFDFPGLGPVHAFTMGHPEAVTLPRRYPGLRRSYNLQSGPDWLLDLLREVGAEHRAGSLSLQQGAERIASHPRPKTKGPRDPLPIEWSLAIGEAAGRPRSVAAFPTSFHPSKMGGNTGIPVAIGVELLRRGKLLDLGVHAPEAAIVPRDFFDLMAPLMEPPLTGTDDLIAIVEADCPRNQP
ncbi:MAG: hypothetical protein HOV67_21385 [Kribbellaceae bacterium]|nr:hypothetical protein [Kribbellaceae bacterium]